MTARFVMPGLDPGHPSSSQNVFTKFDGLHRNSGLPELRSVIRRKSGKPDLRCQARQDYGWSASSTVSVMPGLDPGIHLLRKTFLRRSMDCRVKPGNDYGTRSE
jgi:hypothetical protein